MKIGIVTHPLRTNYGGILQNYALQTVLRSLGHEPVTLRNGRLKFWRLKPLSIGYSLVKLLLGEEPHWNHNIPLWMHYDMRDMNHWIARHITATPARFEFRGSDIDRLRLDALCVGSDQVWRPGFVHAPLDYFLRFAGRRPVLRFSYAASLGVDEWTYSPEQTEAVRELIHQFRAVSVRERSGIALCRDHLGVEADCTIDPTMLLTKAHYTQLCADVPRASQPYVLFFCLDPTPELTAVAEAVGRELNLPVRTVASEAGVRRGDTPSRWLANFRDAAYVLTDSFHGTVFSILFEKDFIAMRNAHRGNARFDDLATRFPIAARMCTPQGFTPALVHQCAPWQAISTALAAEREHALAFLRKVLA